jgi:hypothetical protein
LIPQRFLPLRDFVCKQSVSNPVSNHGFPVRSHQATPDSGVIFFRFATRLRATRRVISTFPAM